MPNQRAENKVIVACFIDADERKDFKESCTAAGTDMSKVLTEFIEEFNMAHKRLVGELRARQKASDSARGTVRRRMGLKPVKR